MSIAGITASNQVAHSQTAASNQTAQSQTAAGNTTETQDVTGKDEFLQLLVTQLQNQDPLDPMDNTEFLSPDGSVQLLGAIDPYQHNVGRNDGVYPGGIQLRAAERNDDFSRDEESRRVNHEANFQ